MPPTRPPRPRVLEESATSVLSLSATRQIVPEPVLTPATIPDASCHPCSTSRKTKVASINHPPNQFRHAYRKDTKVLRSDNVTRQAAKYAQLVQDGFNLRAIAAQMVRDIDAMRQAQKLDGDGINNHPIVLAYVSKLVSLTRLTTEREMAALAAIDRLANGEDVECEVILL